MNNEHIKRLNEWSTVVDEKIENLENQVHLLGYGIDANENILNHTQEGIEKCFERIEKIENEELDKHAIRLGALEKEAFIDHGKRIEKLENWYQIGEESIIKRIEKLEENNKYPRGHYENPTITGKENLHYDIDNICINIDKSKERIEKLEKQMGWIFGHVLGEKNLYNRVQDIEQNWIDYQADSAEILCKIDNIEKGHGIKGDIDSLHDLIIKCNNRIEKIELDIAGKIVRNYETGAMELKQEPKTFGIGEAVEAMQNGKKVSRKLYEDTSQFLCFDLLSYRFRLITNTVNVLWGIKDDDLLATDYFVVE